MEKKRGGGPGSFIKLNLNDYGLYIAIFVMILIMDTYFAYSKLLYSIIKT